MDNTASIIWGSPDSVLAATITIDAQRRIYLSSEARKLLEVETPYRLVFGYDTANKRLIVAKPEVVRVPDIKPFTFDKRHYAHAKKFVRELRLPDGALPAKFEYVGKDYAEYPEGALCFVLVGHDAPDASMIRG